MTVPCKRFGLRWRRWLALSSLVLLATVAWWLYRQQLGDPSARMHEGWHQGHRIVDRDGEVLREIPSELGSRGEPLRLDEIGDRLVVATLVSEDRRFYEHSGVDLAAILRAAGQNVRHVRLVSGASTITQQLVKLLDSGGRPGEGKRTLAVKLREAARANNLEARLSKQAILEAYLNRLSYGRGLVGPAMAASGYFGVSPRELSWAQAALLAVLPRAPSYLDPIEHPKRGRMRQRALLDALREQGLLGDADHVRALAEPLEPRASSWPFEAPHLTEALRAGRLGGLSQGGSTQTTIALGLQRQIEGLLQAHGTRLEQRQASSAAALVVDNATGDVLAYVGSASWQDRAAGQVDMVRARRQPGSTLKPFVYALSFAAGLQPADMVADIPTRFGETSGSYAPGNFDGVFVGPISAREALAGSLNVPAVRLASRLEEGALLDSLHQLGFASLDRPALFYGLSLALGSGEVTLLELAGAYATLARGGETVALRLTVADADQLVGDRVGGTPVMSSSVAAAVSDTLSDPLARVRGLGGSGPFDLGFPVAVKTGTSSGFRDSWTVGYTHERTVAVWVGNADGRNTDGLTGGSGAGPLFADIMRQAMEDVPSRRSLWDEGLLEAVPVCPLSGKRATSACPDTVPRRLIPGRLIPEVAAAEPDDCALHRHARPLRRVGAHAWRCDAAGGQVLVALPDAFAPWLAQQPAGAPGRDPHGLPWLVASQIPGCSEAGAKPRLRIEDPPSGSVLLAQQPGDGVAAQVELVASIAGVGPWRTTPELEFVLDGRVVARVGPPYRAQVAATPGDHLLRVRPADPRLAVRLAESRFSVR